jgi:hypothetical protein
MFKFLFSVIILYLLISFVFNFVIPIFRATRQMRDQVRDFHQKMEQKNREYMNSASQSPRAAEKVEGDYIDFEEIK